MNMQDYGVPPEDQEKIKDYCRSRNMKVEDRLQLFLCAISAAPGLEMTVYESLITGDGYRTLQKKRKRNPCERGRFLCLPP